MKIKLDKSTAVKIATVILFSFSVLCRAEEKVVNYKLAEKYFSENYLYTINEIEGIKETVNAIESLDLLARKPAYVRYFDLGDEYEGKVSTKEEKGKNENAPEKDRRKYLIIAINCYEIVSRSQIADLQDRAKKAVKRCRQRFVSSNPGEFEDALEILQRCIDISEDPSKENKQSKLKGYLGRGNQCEEMANQATDLVMKKKYAGSALDFYGIVSQYTEDEELRKQANDARLRMLQLLASF